MGGGEEEDDWSGGDTLEMFEEDHGRFAQPALLHMLAFVYLWHAADWDSQKAVDSRSGLGLSFACLQMLAYAGSIDRMRGTNGKPGSLVSMFPPLPIEGHVRDFQSGINFAGGIGLEFTSKLAVACEATAASLGFALTRVYRRPRSVSRQNYSEPIDVIVRASDAPPSRPAVLEFGCNHRELQAIESHDTVALLRDANDDELEDRLEAAHNDAQGGRFGLGLSRAELLTFSSSPLQGFGFGIGGSGDVAGAGPDLVQRPAKGNKDHPDGPFSPNLPFDIDREFGDASTFEGKEILSRIEADIKGSAQFAEAKQEWRLACLDDSQMHTIEEALLEPALAIDLEAARASMTRSQTSSTRVAKLDGTGFEGAAVCNAIKQAADSIKGICVRLARIAREDKARVSTGISKLLSGAN